LSFCPKCGNKVDETMTFCPRCGASLKAETSWSTSPAPTTATRPPVRNEKQEKNEKGEKREKQEKGGSGSGGGYMGWLIAGVVIIALGLLAYASSVMPSSWNRYSGAIFLVVIGVLILAAGIYVTTMARTRSPAPT
jgi:hypothetical protein